MPQQVFGLRYELDAIKAPLARHVHQPSRLTLHKTDHLASQDSMAQSHDFGHP